MSLCLEVRPATGKDADMGYETQVLLWRGKQYASSLHIGQPTAWDDSKPVCQRIVARLYEVMLRLKMK